MPPSAISQDAVLAGLRKALEALPKSLPLNGPDGAFPGGAKGKELAKTAVEQGFLIVKEEKVKTGNRSRKVVSAVLTDNGIKHVVEADSPKAALQALLPAVQALGAPQGAPDPEAFRAELHRATDTCVKAIKDAFAGLEAEVLRALAPSPSPAISPGPTLEALRHALERVKVPTLVAAVPPVVQQAPPPTTDLAPDLEGDIQAFVDNRARETTVGCQFDVLWVHLKAHHPQLTIGAFQDALRKLYDVRRISLGGWPQMLDDLPQPELALFVSSKVMYYANPAPPRPVSRRRKQPLIPLPWSNSERGVIPSRPR